MRILINTATTYKGGGVQVASSFLQECRNFPENEYGVILGETIGGMIQTDSFPANFKFYRIDYRPANRVFSFKPRTAFFEEVEKDFQPEVVFTTSGPAYWRPEVPHLMGYNLPHYIYGDSPFFAHLSLKKKIKWKLKGAVVRHFFRNDGDAYVAQSDDVNQRVRKFLGSSRVETVSNTCSAAYFKEPKPIRSLPEEAVGKFKLLTLSAYYVHKNIELIPEIVGLMNEEERKQFLFVLTLPDADFQRIIPVEVRETVYNTGPVPVEDCPALYNEVNAMFLPTLLECFSASYVEAMQMKKPILTTDLGFARGLCGEAAAYYEPMNAADALTKLRELRNDPDLRRSLIERGSERLGLFSTSLERARKYLELCRQLKEEKAE